MIAALLDHLWQSTFFAGGAGLLTIVLKHERARIRYRLWLAASLKFLFPFSILVSVGNALTPFVPAFTLPVTGFALVQRTAQPFAAQMPAIHPATLNPLLLLFAAWLAGFIAVLAIWFSRWWRIRAVLKNAVPFPLAAPIPVKVTASPLGPGLFGIFRPVLLLPGNIAQNLSPRELRAVIDHELCHLERDDNLTAAIHMIVEALFWFHPLVWWLGARLIAERERACDENVVEGGNEAGVYAEGILKVCRFYAIPPPPLAAAVLSADLEGRLRGIMAGRARELTAAKRALIGAAAALAIAWPVATGWTAAVHDKMTRTAMNAHGADAAQLALKRHIAQLQAGLQGEDTTSRADCERHFISVLQVLEKNYGKFAPLYPPRQRNDQDQLPMSLTWKNSPGASRYQEATLYMKVETAHVWDARLLIDGRTIDAAAAWSADNEKAHSLCLTEINVKA